MHVYSCRRVGLRRVLDGIHEGQKDCSNSGGVSRLFMYSSAAHISLRQGLHHFQQYFFFLARSSGLYVSKSESESRRAKDS